MIATIVDMNTEPALDLAQMLITLPAQICQYLIVERLEHDLEAVSFCRGQAARAGMRRRPRNELGNASEISTSANRPIRS